MAEVTRRRTGEFLRKLFEILMPLPDGMQARDALAALEKTVTLTEYENGTMNRAVDGLRRSFASRPSIARRPPGFRRQKAAGS